MLLIHYASGLYGYLYIREIYVNLMWFVYLLLLNKFWVWVWVWVWFEAGQNEWSCNMFVSLDSFLYSIYFTSGGKLHLWSYYQLNPPPPKKKKNQKKKNMLVKQLSRATVPSHSLNPPPRCPITQHTSLPLFPSYRIISRISLISETWCPGSSLIPSSPEVVALSRPGIM